MRSLFKDPRICLLLAIAAAIGVGLAAPSFNRYYMGIAIDVGINIILAVSLNLINGHTGQFSLGHAGFMAVGGYSATFGLPTGYKDGVAFVILILILLFKPSGLLGKTEREKV